jgi:hypothetical protein
MHYYGRPGNVPQAIVVSTDPSRYINKMEDAYKQHFKESPNQKHISPLVKGDHPELDMSEFLDQDGIDIYQSLVEAMQWAISIGHWDIQSAVIFYQASEHNQGRDISIGSNVSNVSYVD